MSHGEDVNYYYELEKKYGPTGAVLILRIAEDFMNAGHGISLSRAIAWATEQYEMVQTLVERETV